MQVHITCFYVIIVTIVVAVVFLDKLYFFFTFLISNINDIIDANKLCNMTSSQVHKPNIRTKQLSCSYLFKSTKSWDMSYRINSVRLDNSYNINKNFKGIICIVDKCVINISSSLYQSVESKYIIWYSLS